jgi:hypothetical protein
MEEIARRDELWVLLPGFRMSEWAESRGNSVLTHNNTAISAPASAKQRMHKVPASPNLKYARKYFKPFAVATARPIPMPVTQLEQAFPSIIPVNAKMPKKQACGGIAGRPCADGGTCVDDPSDNCDPKRGDADCIGICEAK